MARDCCRNKDHHPILCDGSHRTGNPGPRGNPISHARLCAGRSGLLHGEFLPTEARQLYVDLSGKAALLWRQPGRSIIWGVPSPDGRNLAMLMYTTDANVYMLDAF